MLQLNHSTEIHESKLISSYSWTKQ